MLPSIAFPFVMGRCLQLVTSASVSRRSSSAWASDSSIHDVVPADRIALFHVVLEENVMCERDRKKVTVNVRACRHQFAPDGVSAFAIEVFARCEVRVPRVLGDGDVLVCGLGHDVDALLRVERNPLARASNARHDIHVAVVVENAADRGGARNGRDLLDVAGGEDEPIE
jgi:hypothetical protein